MQNKYKILAIISLFSSSSLFGAEEQSSITLLAPSLDFLSFAYDLLAYFIKAWYPAIGIGLGLCFFGRAIGLFKFFAGGGKEYYNEFLEWDKQGQEARYKKWLARKKGMDAEDREAFEQLKEDYANLVDDKQQKKKEKEAKRIESLLAQGYLLDEIERGDFETRDKELAEDLEISEDEESEEDKEEDIG